MVINGIRMPECKQEIYDQLSKEQLIHLIGEYKHALFAISANCVEASKLHISDHQFQENIRTSLSVLNMYDDYESKELSDEIKFRMGKIDASEWRARRGLEYDQSYDGVFWNLGKQDIGTGYRACGDCMHCRHNGDEWYCRRSYTEVLPSESACDDFEEND